MLNAMALLSMVMPTQPPGDMAGGGDGPSDPGAPIRAAQERRDAKQKEMALRFVLIAKVMLVVVLLVLR